MTHPIVIHPQNALVSFASLLAAISQTPYKLYLLIDEYDNFANEVLMSNAREGQERYEEIVKADLTLHVPKTGTWRVGREGAATPSSYNSPMFRQLASISDK